MSALTFPMAPAEAYAFPGGYPIGYLVDDGEYLCAQCVNDEDNPVHIGGDADGWRLEGLEVLEGSAEDYDGEVACAHCGRVLVWDEARIRGAGVDAGRAAGSWIIDGNTGEDEARRLLIGYEDGDPAVLDIMPAPLSGEWAGDPTPADIVPDDSADGSRDHLLDLYEEGFAEGFWDEVTRAARVLVTPDEDEVFEAYVACALWSSTDEDGDPLDDIYGADDVAPETLETMRAEVRDFLTACARAGVTFARIAASQCGHDFWLTRNRHGAGFWDRGLEDIGDQLTELAHAYGSADLYVGDDGRIYQA